MRLTSDLWVAAFIRTVRGGGGFAYLARRGAEEAGAIFIAQQCSGGGADGGAGGEAVLYGPAPQLFYEEAEGFGRGDRLFMQLCRGSEAELAARLSQELNFDPDIWIIEVENFPCLHQAGALRLIAPENV